VANINVEKEYEVGWYGDGIISLDSLNLGFTTFLTSLYVVIVRHDNKLSIVHFAYNLWPSGS
jgi:hypothetical protein